MLFYSQFVLTYGAEYEEDHDAYDAGKHQTNGEARHQAGEHTVGLVGLWHKPPGLVD